MDKSNLKEKIVELADVLSSMVKIIEADMDGLYNTLICNAETLCEKSEEFLTYLYDNDIDSVKGKIPDIGQYFKDDPVAELTEAAVLYLQNVDPEKQQERVRKAIEQIRHNTKGSESKALYERAVALDEGYFNEVHTLLDEIEEHLNKREEFSKEDLELIRYYLKNKAYDNEDIDMLDDNTVITAWKFKQYKDNEIIKATEY